MNDHKIIVRRFCECQMIFKFQLYLGSFLAKTLAISRPHCDTYTLPPLDLTSLAGARHISIISICGVWPRQARQQNCISIQPTFVGKLCQCKYGLSHSWQPKPESSDIFIVETWKTTLSIMTLGITTLSNMGMRVISCNWFLTWVME
jgi:hypothetical protein